MTASLVAHDIGTNRLDGEPPRPVRDEREPRRSGGFRQAVPFKPGCAALPRGWRNHSMFAHPIVSHPIFSHPLFSKEK